MRLAIARFWYEGNSFSPVPATRADFATREWYRGDEASAYYAGKGVEAGAAVDYLRDHPDVEGTFLRCAAAYPAGPVEAGLFGEFLDEVEAGLRAGSWDGVYLSLHGASVCADHPAPERALLERVRACVGSGVPVAASFDLHANHHPEIAGLLDILVGYKTHPHVDMYETGARALALLDRAMRGEIDPVTRIVPAGTAPTSFNMQTGHGPMARLVAMAAACEAELGCHDVTAFGGFVYADTPYTGASVTLCAERGHAGLDEAGARIAAAMRAAEAEFDVRLPAPGPLLDALRDHPPSRPVALIEPADNTFSGGAGDTPDLLRAVLDHAPDLPAVFAFFWDPELVRRAAGAGVGAVLEATLGGRLSRDFGEPVPVTARVVRLTDGRFVNDGPMERNLRVELGPTAVLQVRALQIIVSSRNVPANDPAYFRLHGIDPDRFTLLYAKAKNHFRAAFGERFERIVDVDGRGPAPADAAVLPFRHLPRSRLPRRDAP